jgi:hypothetical protein
MFSARGQEPGKINPDEYIIDGNLTPKAKRTALYTFWNKPPDYEELIRPFALVYEDSYVKIYELSNEIKTRKFSEYLL